MTGFADYDGSGYGEWYNFTSVLLICHIFSLVNIDIMIANR